MGCADRVSGVETHIERHRTAGPTMVASLGECGMVSKGATTVSLCCMKPGELSDAAVMMLSMSGWASRAVRLRELTVGE